VQPVAQKRLLCYAGAFVHRAPYAPISPLFLFIYILDTLGCTIKAVRHVALGVEAVQPPSASPSASSASPPSRRKKARIARAAGLVGLRHALGRIKQRLAV
jgi:hypothetical protein